VFRVAEAVACQLGPSYVRLVDWAILYPPPFGSIRSDSTPTS